MRKKIKDNVKKTSLEPIPKENNREIVIEIEEIRFFSQEQKESIKFNFTEEKSRVKILKISFATNEFE